MAPTPEQVAAMLSRCHLFRGITEENLAFAAFLLVPLDIPMDKLVFEQGEEAAAFYFVFSGRLKATRYSKVSHEDEMVGFLDEGDFFGLDVFQENVPSQMSVDAVTDVTLLMLDIPAARKLFSAIPEMVPRMRMVIDSYNLQFRVPLNWRNPEEIVYYLAQKHPIFLWQRIILWLIAGVVLAGAFLGLLSVPHMTVVLLVLGMGLLVVAGFLVWHYIDWSNDYCIVTGRRIVFQEKIVLLYDSRQESPIEQIQSITVDTTQLGRIFNFGDVVIRSFTGTIYFMGVRQPNDLVGMIQEMQKRTQSSLRQAELRQIEDVLKQRIGMTPPKPPAPPKPQSAVQSARVTQIQKFMADLFHLRYVTGDTIQYRTHWWILFRRIWFQTLVLLTIIGLQVWMLVQSVVGQMNGFPVLGVFFGLCAVGLVIFLWWLYEYVDWHNDIYLINSEQVVDLNKRPLGNEVKKVAQIKNILSVEYKRLGIIGLMLNYGTVYIRIGETTFTFDDVFNPSEVQRELFHRISQRTIKERQAQGEAERQRMADWISAYHRITHRNM
jgi:hypothetical protein